MPPSGIAIIFTAAHFVILSGVKYRMFDHVKAEQ